MSDRSTRSRRVERRAVNDSQTFFEDHDLIFQEIDLRNDIGKDAILDLARSGADAGLSVALQIKGGKKYKRRTGHAIPLDHRLRYVWSNSSLPVFVIVRDVDDGNLYWGNISHMLAATPIEARTMALLPDVSLTPNGLAEFLESARFECSSRRIDPLLNLTSPDSSLVQSALFDCLGPGRRDPRYLRLVRFSISAIGDEKAFWAAVDLLAHATPHPDIFWHKENMIEPDIAKEIRRSYRWSPAEISMLLARMPEDEVWGRGTVAQSLYMLLVSDPSLEWSLERAMLEGFRSDELTWRSSWIKGPPFGPKWVRTDRSAVIFPSFTLSLYLASDPVARVQELTESMPPLMNNEMCREVVAIVEEFGSIDIF